MQVFEADLDLDPLGLSRYVIGLFAGLYYDQMGIYYSHL